MEQIKKEADINMPSRAVKPSSLDIIDIQLDETMFHLNKAYHAFKAVETELIRMREAVELAKDNVKELKGKNVM